MPRLFGVLVSAVLALCAGNAFAQAAYVHDMTGTVTSSVGTTQRALKIGDLVDAGAIVTTGDRSSAVVKFEDGQVMALTERSSFRIVEYKYNKQRVSDSSAVFSLLRGGLRFISGVIGSTNRNAFRMNVGTATIGIRGTDGSVMIDAVTNAVIAAVNAGALTMETPQGRQDIGVGEYSSFTAGQRPTASEPTAAATAAVKGVLDNLAATQNLPVNTPSVITASAKAAADQANARNLAAQAAAQPGNVALQTAAQDAAKQAQESLQTAIQAGQDAYQDAINAGAVPPAPAAPPGPAPGTTGDTGSSPGATGTSSTPSGGAGAGGGGTGSTASPN